MLCNPQLYGVPLDVVDTDPLMQVGCAVWVGCGAVGVGCRMWLGAEG